MTKTVLLTLGRLPKALELARALKSAGCRVVVAEPFGWHVCRPSTAVDRSIRVAAPNTNTQQYLDDLIRVIAEERVDFRSACFRRGAACSAPEAGVACAREHFLARPGTIAAVA